MTTTMEFDKEQLFKEFMNAPTDMEKRNQYPFSDEFVFRRAKIYECLGPLDDRLRVQILPEFYEIDKDEKANLPAYPPFFNGQVITGMSEKKDGDAAEFVWVICTADFQVGYILGKANNFGDSTQKFPQSYGYAKVKQYLAARSAVPKDFDYDHLTVMNWFESDKGGMIQCFNYITGDYVLLNTSGSVFTLQQQRIYMRVGTPADPPAASAFSAITLTPDRITLKSPNIHIDGDDIILGHGTSLNLVGTLGSGVIIGKNGVSCQGVSSIHV